jgi:hypothetical protein
MNDSTRAEQSARKSGRSGQTRFGIDHADGKLVLGSVRIPFPRSRFARLGIGFALILGGVLGFLPILGFWMLPLGFVVLSTESAIVRRWRRRFSVWWARRRRA